MAFWDKEEKLLTIDKNKSEKLEIIRAEKNGKEFIQICTLKQFAGEIEFKHSNANVSIPADKFKEISDLVLNEPKDTAK
jgi:hypothetical protein